jgi:hypothetical protein
MHRTSVMNICSSNHYQSVVSIKFHINFCCSPSFNAVLLQGKYRFCAIANLLIQAMTYRNVINPLQV